MAGFAPFNHESFRGPNNEPIWLRLPVAVLTSLTVWQYLRTQPLLSAIRIAKAESRFAVPFAMHERMTNSTLIKAMRMLLVAFLYISHVASRRRLRHVGCKVQVSYRNVK